MIKTDFHTHCLPEMDDGAESVEMSVLMLQKLKAQGIENIVLTSHYYPQNEDIETFLSRREEKYKLLTEAVKGLDLPKTMLGAEVNLVRNISERDLRPLCLQGTDFILLEMPYGAFEPWVIAEIENIMYDQKLCPIIAHIDRYLQWFKISDFDNLLSLDGLIYQLNASAFAIGKTRKFAFALAEARYSLVLGTDAHNMKLRTPDFSPFFKAMKKKNAEPLFAAAFARSNRRLPFEV